MKRSALLFLDGVYVERRDGSLRFRWVKAPTSAELTRLTEALARRIGRYLERQGLLGRDATSRSMTGSGRWRGYRYTLESRRGLMNARASSGCVDTSVGLRSQFKIAPGDFVEPLDFIARLAALMLKPRDDLTRLDARHPWRAPCGRTACVLIHSRQICHGVFAPNSSYRARVTPAKRGMGSQYAARADREEQPTPAERLAAMTWAQRLKRVFGLDIDQTAGLPGGTAAACRASFEQEWPRLSADADRA
jgi:hypothetical protein